MTTKRTLSPAATDLTYWHGYFKNRVSELTPINGTVWAFVCSCILLEVLTKLINGKGVGKISRIEYEKFIEDWLPAGYKNFRFKKLTRVKTGTTSRMQDKYLPTQMYCILRCGVVHSYSFVAGPKELANVGRSRSIWLTSKSGGTATQAHLSQFSRTNILPEIEDAAFFVAEEFLQDIGQAIDDIFNQAKTDPALMGLIVKHLTEQRPIGG